MRKITALLLCAAIAFALLAPSAFAAATVGDTPSSSTQDSSTPGAADPSPISNTQTGDGQTSNDPQTAAPVGPAFQIIGTAPKYEQGETISGFTIQAKNVSGSTLENVRMEMKPSGDLAVYPFEIREQSYLSDPQQVTAGSTISLSVPSLRVRGDAAVGYYDLAVYLYYTPQNGQPETQTGVFRVFVGPPSGSGAASTETTHIPKVIISGFTTNPAEVVAGEDFTLSVTFKNTSDSVSVSNMKAALTSEVFNPVSGSSTLFVESLPPGSTKAMSIKLHAKADAAPGSYNVSFALNYDVGVQTKDNAPVTDTEVVAIPVKQVPKVQVSTMQVVPSDIYVGNDVNIMTSVNNTGKSTLYNVSAKITDENGLFTLGEQYLGNLQSGASGAVDLYITPQSAGSTSIQLNVSYEDEDGNVYNATQKVEASVMEKETVMPDFPVEPVEPADQGGGGWWIWVVVLLVVAGVVTLVLVKRRRAKRRAEMDRLAAKRLEEEYFNPESKEDSTV